MSVSASAPAKQGTLQGPDAGMGASAARPWLPGTLITNTSVLVLALAGLNLLCYYRSLGGYFLADDYVHIPYLNRVFQGHFDMLLQNFAGNWMQTQGTCFYRPFISLTLALDYLIGGANPVVFHVSTLAYQILSSIFLFLLSRRMLREYGDKRAAAAAFFAGAIFAVFPLHPEVASWVIGRVDSVCTAFYLAAFWLFVRAFQQRGRWSHALSLGAFVISLLSKEMAVTLPAALVLYCLAAAPEGSSVRQRLKFAASKTWMYWAIIAAYLIVRTAALGTITGGYSGSIGEGLSTSLLKRWFQDGSLGRVLFPLNAELFGPKNWLRKALTALYLAASASLGARIILKPASAGLTRFAFFAAAWFALSMIPTYQVWNLTETLQGSRFIYLGTAPLSLLLVLLVYPLGKTADKHAAVPRWPMLVAAAILTGFVILFAIITYRNNLPWAQAGAQVRALRQGIEEALRAMPPGKQLVVLNLPQRHHGAHMLYNAAMLSVLLSPPLSRENLAERVATFEPITYGDSGLIVSSRLRRYASTPDRYVFCTFDQSSRQLIPVELRSSEGELSYNARALAGAFADASKGGSNRGKPVTTPSAGGLTVSDPRRPVCLVSPVLDLPSTATDFVDVDLSLRQSTAQRPAPAPILLLRWESAAAPSFSAQRCLAMPLVADGKPHRYRFAVSQHKQWIASGLIRHIALELLTGGNYTACLSGVRLLRGVTEIPVLEPDWKTLHEDLAGVARPVRSKAAFRYDVSALPGANRAVAELSKPNAWFEHYSGQYRDADLSPFALKRFELTQRQGTFEIPLSELPAPAYYQVRIAGVGADGHVVGYVSDPVNLQISEDSIRGARKARHGGSIADVQ
ncbi:MAG TPA: glycosyltransferase family 39 protein [Candidatus Obscuribacterales bacterium]